MTRLVIQYLPFALVCLTLKAARTVLLAGAAPLTLLDSLAPEAGVHAMLLGLAGLCCAIWRGRLAHTCVAAGLSLAALALILLELVSATFALETGGALDHHLFRFATAQLISLMPLIEAEISLPQIGSLVLIAMAGVGLRAWQIARRPVGEVRAGPAAAWLVAGVLLAALLPLRVPEAIAMPMPLELALGPLLTPVEVAAPGELELAPLTRAGRLERAPGEPAFDHLVVVALESTGWFATSLVEGGLPTTPFLASLADEGVLFERAYTVVPHSSKALVALNCGVVPYLLMEVRESEPGGIPVRCLPDLLREQGFQTLYFGSHVGGFEGRRRLAKNLGFAVTVTAERLDTNGFAVVNYISYEDDALLEPTREWLARIGSRRLYAFYLTSTAHHDYRVPEDDYTQRFDVDDRRDRYLNAVRYQDRFLEKLVAIYREAGLASRTLFVIVGDHGEAFGEHGRRLHDHVPYDEALRVPLLFYGAGLPAERRADPVSHLDVMPAALRLLGFSLQGGVQDGVDAFARGPDTLLYASCWYSERCLARIGKQHKLISHFSFRAPEAFEIDADPRELRDVYGADPGDAAALRELHAWKAQQLARWRASAQPNP